jgi:hypothetical protein
MRKSLLLVVTGLLFIALAILDFSRMQVAQGSSMAPAEISGQVVDANGPLSGAIVQIQGAPQQQISAADGSFTFSGLRGRLPLVVTAWAEGYFVGYSSFEQGQELVIHMNPLFEKDNLSYDWFEFNGVQGSASCGLCHREYEEWLADAHSQAATNPRFISIYRGTNVGGDLSQPVRYDENAQPLPPDPDLPYYGPGYRLDEPQRAGNCAACHTPQASKISNTTNCAWSGCHTDLTAERSEQVDTGVLPLNLTGDAADGIGCDFCHKIGEVYLDPETNLPYPDKPGILSMRLYRPEEGQQVFFGTLVDVNRRVSYLPLQSESAYCAPCHYGVFGGVVGHNTVAGGVIIYNSYGEWLESPYSDPETGKTCQDCHMPVLEDVDYFVFPDQGGIKRKYATLHDHTMPGASDEQLLQNSVTMTVEAKASEKGLQVVVSITNDQTGHHIPTDAPIRQMLLVVEAVDTSGNRLVQVSGPVLPEWTGDLAGLAGAYYAKLLRDEWSGEIPTAAYWRPVSIAEDTRLAALEKDSTQYTFDLSAGVSAEVHVRLLFRRAFYEIAELKGWQDPDILMEEATIQVEAGR